MLARELDRSSGLRLWWRDDDATTPTPALERLLALRARLGLPLALAVIPRAADAALPDALAGPEIGVLAHGWDHTDHSPAGAPAAELGPLRDPAQVRDQLCQGRRRLEGLFGARFLPVLVPPFNQLAPGLVPAIREAGFGRISIDRDFAGFGLPATNVHADVVDWRRGTAAEPAGVVRGLLVALRLRRLGVVRRGTPIGIMTHHLAHDEAAWALSEELLTRLSRHPAVTFAKLGAILPP